MALPFAAPPDIPADRAAALQAAFMAMLPRQGFPGGGREARLRRQARSTRRKCRRCWPRSAATPRDVIARYNALGDPQK